MSALIFYQVNDSTELCVCVSERGAVRQVHVHSERPLHAYLPV